MPISEIKCPIDITELPQYTGFEQYQQVIAIEVPVVYDQCLIKKCLLDEEDPRILGATPICPEHSYTAVSGLTAEFKNVAVGTPVNFRGFRDFKVTINSVSSTTVSSTQKSVTINYELEFIAEVFLGADSESETITISNLTETVLLDYPSNVSQISVSTNSSPNSLSSPTFKIVLLPDIANSGAYFIYEPASGGGCGQGNDKVDVTAYFNICYTLMIKVELESQILIPFYGFYNTGKTCSSSADTCPCIQCLNTAPGPFYPPIDFSVFDCVSSTPLLQKGEKAPLATPTNE